MNRHPGPAPSLGFMLWVLFSLLAALALSIWLDAPIGITGGIGFLSAIMVVRTFQVWKKQ